MKQLILPSSALERVKTFLSVYRAADNDADVDVHIGMMEGGIPAIVIVVSGSSHGFTSDEARRLAKIAEDGMNACLDDPQSAGLPNLILALRAGADKADKAFASP